MNKPIGLDDLPRTQAPPLPDNASGANGQPAVRPSRARPAIPVDIETIVVPEGRLRRVDPDAADSLARSIAGIGLQSPLILTPDPDDDNRHILIAGAHRLAAAGLLGWTAIDAFVIDDGVDYLDLIEIDENLIRRELTALDRSLFLHRRKDIYNRIHGSPHGGDRRSEQFSRNERYAQSWLADSAESIGLSKRMVQRSALIGANLLPDLANALAATPLADREKDLYRLAQMPHERQERILQLLKEWDPPPKTLAELIGPAEPESPGAEGPRHPSGAADPFEILVGAWQAADTDTREKFLEYLRGHRPGDAEAAPEDDAPADAGRSATPAAASGTVPRLS